MTKKISTNNKNYYLYKKCNYLFAWFITTLITYVLGVLLFISSVEIIVMKSITTNGYEWNNLNLVWIFGFVIIFIGLCFNFYLLFTTMQLQSKLYQEKRNLIKYKNKYIEKWLKNIHDKNKTFHFFMNIFNIQVWLSSIKKNLLLQENDETKTDSNQKLKTIVQSYYEQLKQKEKEKQKH